MLSGVWLSRIRGLMLCPAVRVGVYSMWDYIASGCPGAEA